MSKQKVRIVIVKMIVRATFFLAAIRVIFKPKLGDFVRFDGELCRLIQGVRNPYWDLLPLDEENLKKSVRKIYRSVHVSDFKITQNPARLWFSYQQRWNFFMSNWYDINVKNYRFKKLKLFK
jgi:hypothetical protein